MKSFREFLNEKEKGKSYKDFFKEKLKKYSVESPDELSIEDKKKFFDEIDAEWESEKEEPEEISEGVRGTNLSDKDFKEFSKLLSERVKWIKDEMKDGHVGDIAGMTESFANALLKWVKKLKQSDIR